MNLRPRRREDPEINLINFIDVLLVLLIFFMVSTTFNQEGRVKVQLPQASEIPLPRGSREPLVITVTAEGGYRVNERAADQREPGHLARGAPQGSRHGSRTHHDPRGCAHDSPGGRDGDGCCRPARLRAAQYRDRSPGTGSLSAISAASAGAPETR